MLIRRILYIEWLFFFFISLISFSVVLFNLENSNHIFSIQGSGELSWLSYYGISFFMVISYFTGPWVMFPFIFFSLAYFKVFRDRRNIFDLFFVWVISLGFMSLFYWFAQDFLGTGTLWFIERLGGSKLALSLFFLSFILSISILREKKPWTIFLNFLKALGILLDEFKNKIKLLGESLKKKKKFHKSAKASPDLNKKERKRDIEKSQDIENPENLKKKSVKASEEFGQKESEKPVSPSSPEKKVLESKESLSYKAEVLIEALAPENGGNTYEHPDDIYFNEIRKKLEETLREFKIDAEVIDVLKGPVVDTFEIELGPGVRVSKVTAIQDELTLALSGAPIRVVYPMKGRTTIGIEVPRNPREVILLDEVLSGGEFSKTKARLPVCMGKDAFGEVFVVDLTKMPHMLVAGATGAGKSVFINTLLVSLLVKKTHRELKLILIDPKQLELAQYVNLPHLCLPVVTEPSVASASLMWAVEEMEKRYTMLKEMGVRNLEGFNQKVKNVSPEKLGMIHQYYLDPDEHGYELPYIVIIVDEFADLILTKEGKDIETSICRLAAKARAAGIHIVLATQRPSVDVITGLIKNNFPTRVSFRVTSSMDSKTILTKVGAEKLLGMGDMLYKNGVEMVRVHSAYVGEEEIDVLCEKLEEIPQVYSQAALDFIEDQKNSAEAEALGGGLDGDLGKDALFDEAVKIVREAGGASASMLQRRLRVGYNRAANLIDQMELSGIIGPANGSKPREILSIENLD